jgi:basic membrane lipoprotein Med (substrate-binding protein (PBP1-ABC) superfamily)
MMKTYTSVMLIAAVVGIMIAGALAVTTTSAAFAIKIGGGKDDNGVNNGNGHGHERACENQGASDHNPHCQ